MELIWLVTSVDGFGSDSHVLVLGISKEAVLLVSINGNCLLELRRLWLADVHGLASLLDSL